MGLTTQTYDILTRIAIGNGALVYRGVEKTTLRQVAIKLLTQDGDLDHRFDIPSLLAAAPRLRQIAGSHVCQLLEVIEDEDGPVLVYEFANGRSGQELPQHKQLDAAQALDVAAQLISAVRSGERQRTPHGDLKPSNVVFVEATEERPYVMVLDWGLAAFRAEPGKDSLPYVAPERLQGGPVSHSADLFAAGAVLFYLLTGKVLAMGETAEELMEGWSRAKPAVLAELRPDLPPKLVQWICGLLVIDPAKRPASAVDAGNALAALNPPPPMIPPESIRPRPMGAAQRAAQAAPVSGVVAPRPSSVTRPIPSGVRSAPGSGALPVPQISQTAAPRLTAGPGAKRSKGALVIMLVAVLAAGGGATAWWLNREGATPSVADSSVVADGDASSDDSGSEEAEEAPAIVSTKTPVVASAATALPMVAAAKPPAAPASAPAPTTPAKPGIREAWIIPQDKDYIAVEDFRYGNAPKLDGGPAGTGWSAPWKGGEARLEKESLKYGDYPTSGGRAVFPAKTKYFSVSRSLGSASRVMGPPDKPKHWYFAALVKHSDGTPGPGGEVRFLPFESAGNPVQIVITDVGSGLRVELEGAPPIEVADASKPVLIMSYLSFTPAKAGKAELTCRLLVNPVLEVNSFKDAGPLTEIKRPGVVVPKDMQFKIRKAEGSAQTEVDEIRFGKHWAQMSFQKPRPTPPAKPKP
jgi:hypothetical protein